jgi:hypothetical protein
MADIGAGVVPSSRMAQVITQYMFMIFQPGVKIPYLGFSACRDFIWGIWQGIPGHSSTKKADTAPKPQIPAVFLESLAIVTFVEYCWG